MYIVGSDDKVIEIVDLPQSSVGAPIPIVLADEHVKVIAYYIQENEIDYSAEKESIAIVTFKHCRAMMFGPPNDEAFSGHPLYSRGLRPYSSHIVKNSSWIRSLSKMNEVHPYHRPERFASDNHYVLAFHDSTFECIAENYQVETILGTVQSAIEIMRKKLG